MTRNYIPDCRQSKGWVIYKAYRVVASSNAKDEELTKKYISNRIKYPQHDLKQDEAIRQINLGVDDRVLSLTGQLYHFGTRSFEDSDHDWYCYKCHEIGNVFKCSSCWRVYHLSCANFTDEECAVCEHLRQVQPSVRNEVVTRERINEILRQILNKVSDDSKQLLTLSTIEGNFYNSVPIREIKKLVFNSRINFNVMEAKIARHEYKSFLEFLCDCEDICHNMLVLHGPKGRIAKLVDRMFSFVQKDIDLVSACLTCYRCFYEKRDPMYNQNQCTPPHEIAFVKYKAFPLWPCKIISVNDRRIQTWFFGATSTECIRCYAQKKSVFTIEEAKNILATKVQPSSTSKTYQKAIYEYDTLMEKLAQPHNKVGHLLIHANGETSTIQYEGDEEAEKAPSNFQLAMSESWNGASAAANNSQNQMTNGNTKSSDGVSNLSFTFNGDSQNNSTSNPTDLEFATNTPVKNESRYDKVSTPKNFHNLSSSISNGNSSNFKSSKKAFNKSYVSDFDIKEENKQLKRRLKETEDKVGELKQALKESYTKEYVDNLNQEYKSMLGDVKKKTWCRVCEKEAFYYCCCNIFYCSIDCQSKDWWATHKNQCFRKKQKKQKEKEQKEKQALEVK